MIQPHAKKIPSCFTLVSKATCCAYARSLNPYVFLLKQLDYKPEFSMSDSQLGCASLTIRSQKTRACSLIVNYKTHAMLGV